MPGTRSEKHLLAQHFQPCVQRFGGLVGSKQTGMGIEVGGRVARLEPVDRADERFGDGQGEPLRSPGGLHGFVDGRWPL